MACVRTGGAWAYESGQYKDVHRPIRSDIVRVEGYELMPALRWPGL